MCECEKQETNKVENWKNKMNEYRLITPYEQQEKDLKDAGFEFIEESENNN